MATATSIATADTWLNGAAASQATNYSTDATAFAGWVSGGGGGAKRPLLYFPIAGILPVNSTSILLGLYITSAPVVAGSLGCYQYDEVYNGQIVAAQATWLNYATAAPWGAPGGDYSPTPTKAFTGPTSANENTIFSIDVSDVVLPAAAAAWDGIWLTLRNAAESGATKQFSFATLEGANPFPTLTATYPSTDTARPTVGGAAKHRVIAY